VKVEVILDGINRQSARHIGDEGHRARADDEQRHCQRDRAQRCPSIECPRRKQPDLRPTIEREQGRHQDDARENPDG